MELHEKYIKISDIGTLLLESNIFKNCDLKEVSTEFEKLQTIEAIPKDQYEQRLMADITDKSVDEGYLNDWYISSVTDAEPKWTEAHIKELVNDFYLIPKQEDEDGKDNN